MPRKFRRKFGRKRKGFWGRVRGHLGGATSAMGMAGTALKGFWQLKKLINAEFKNFDVPAAGFGAVTTGGTIQSLSQIAEGDDFGQRTGRSILGKSIYVMGTLSMNASAFNSCLRFILFYDTQYNGAMPVVTDVLASANWLSPLNINTISSQRFKIIWDKMFDMQQNGRQGYTFKKYFKLNHHLKYNATTGTAASGLSGQVLVLLIGSEVTNTPSINYSSRLRYVDN